MLIIYFLTYLKKKNHRKSGIPDFFFFLILIISQAEVKNVFLDNKIQIV